MKNLIIYTDGGCHPNPGLGACAFVILSDGQIIAQQAYKKMKSTNNEMEMSAIIAALMWIREYSPDSRVYLNTDSQYVQLGITKWIKGWKKKQWKTSKGKDVKNKELWLKLNELVQKLDVHFQWVKGHSGDKWNDYVDQMCTDKINQYK